MAAVFRGCFFRGCFAGCISFQTKAADSSAKSRAVFYSAAMVTGETRSLFSKILVTKSECDRDGSHFFSGRMVHANAVPGGFSFRFDWNLILWASAMGRAGLIVELGACWVRKVRHSKRTQTQHGILAYSTRNFANLSGFVCRESALQWGFGFTTKSIPASSFLPVLRCTCRVARFLLWQPPKKAGGKMI